MNDNNRRKISSLISRRTLFVGLCGGIISVLVDADHPISLWLTGQTSRALHIPLAIVSCLVLCGIGAYLGGLLVGMVLKK